MTSAGPQLLTSNDEELRWVKAALRTARSSSDLAGIVPDNYQSYVRILHPAYDSAGHRVKWSEIAEAAGRPVTNLMQWSEITDLDLWPAYNLARRSELVNQAPNTGILDIESLQELVQTILKPGAIGHYIAAYWDGWAWMRGDGLYTQHARARVSELFSQRVRESAVQVSNSRRYITYRGTQHEILSITEGVLGDPTPNMLWPQDRSWFIATETDFDSTIVGCNLSTGRAILTSDIYEAWPVLASDSLTLK